jgi:hypothetical protein
MDAVVRRQTNGAGPPAADAAPGPDAAPAPQASTNGSADAPSPDRERETPVDEHDVADRVYALVQERLVRERDRRGL